MVQTYKDKVVSYVTKKGKKKSKVKFAKGAPGGEKIMYVQRKEFVQQTLSQQEHPALDRVTAYKGELEGLQRQLTRLRQVNDRGFPLHPDKEAYIDEHSRTMDDLSEESEDSEDIFRFPPH